MVSKELKSEFSKSLFLIIKDNEYDCINKKNNSKYQKQLFKSLISKFTSNYDQFFIKNGFYQILYLVYNHLRFIKIELNKKRTVKDYGFLGFEKLIFDLFSQEIESMVNWATLNDQSEIKRLKKGRRKNIEELKDQFLFNFGNSSTSNDCNNNNSNSNNNNIISNSNLITVDSDYFSSVFTSTNIDIILNNIRQLNKSELSALHDIISRKRKLLEKKLLQFNNLVNQSSYGSLNSKQKNKVVEFKFIEEIGKNIQREALKSLLKNSDSNTKHQFTNQLDIHHSKINLSAKLIIKGSYSNQSLQEFKYGNVIISESKFGNTSMSSLLNTLFKQISTETPTLFLNNSRVNNNNNNLNGNCNNSDYFSLIFKSSNIDVILNTINDLAIKENNLINKFQHYHRIINKHKLELERKCKVLDGLVEYSQLFATTDQIKQQVMHFKLIEEIGRVIQREELKSLKTKSMKSQDKWEISHRLDSLQGNNKITASKFLNGIYTQTLQNLTYNGITIEEPRIGTSTITSVLLKLFNQITNLIKNYNNISFGNGSKNNNGSSFSNNSSSFSISISRGDNSSIEDSFSKLSINENGLPYQQINLKKEHIDVINLNDEDIVDLILETAPQKIPLLQVSSLRKLNDTFDNHQDYVKSFKPLVVEEFLRQIEKQFCELDDKISVNQQDGMLSNLNRLEMNKGISNLVIRESNDCSVEISIRIKLESRDNKLMIHDLVLFKISVNSSTSFILGRVKNSSRVSASKVQRATVLFMVSNQNQGFIDKLLFRGDDIFYLKVSNTISFKREISALSAINNHLLCDFIVSPTIEKDKQLKIQKYSITSSSNFTQALNSSQYDSVDSSLYTRGINLIQGPPGTGKTHTIYTLVKILLSISSKFKILICAPSHAAVDEIAKRLMKDYYNEGTKESSILRIGRKDKVSKDVHPICYFGHSIKKREIFYQNKIVCLSTLSASASTSRVNLFQPDIIIVDESTQSCESSTIIPLATSYNAKKLILVGDPVQLPPTIFSKDSIDCGFNISLFERLSKVISVQMLDTQYRMHPQISYFPSKEFYSSRLLNGKNVQHYDSSNRFYNDPNFGPIAFYNITDSQEEKGTKSIKNSIEIKMIFLLIKMLVQDYPELKQLSFGVITPYKLQRKSINEAKSIFNEPIDIEVNTVDGFQGGEKDIIIFSSVRNEKMGFLSDRRRINVAITRAKYALFIIGNKQLLDRDRTWGPYIKYIQSLGRIKSINASDINKLLVITKEHDLLHPEGLITDFKRDDSDDDFETKEGLYNEDFDEEYQNSDSDTESDSDSDSDDEWVRVESSMDNIPSGIKNEMVSLLNFNSNNSSSKDYISNFYKLLLYYKNPIINPDIQYQISKKLRYLRNRIQEYKNSFIPTTYPSLSDFSSQIHSLKSKQDVISLKQLSFGRLKKFLKEGFSTANLELYGSFLSDISLEGGDLDVCFSTYQNEDKSPILQMKNYLERSKLYKILEVRTGATIPIIRFLEISTRIQFDMCFNHRIGIFRSLLIKEYCSIDERCRELILLVKYWALKKYINDAGDNTFSSFCLVMMVIHFLQNGVNPPILPNLQSFSSPNYLLKANVIVEEQLIKFLDSTSIKFNSKLNNSTTSQLFYSFFKYYIQFNYDEFAINISKGPNVKRELIQLPEYIDSLPIVVLDMYSSRTISSGITKKSFKTIMSEISLLEYHLRLGYTFDSILDKELALKYIFNSNK